MPRTMTGRALALAVALITGGLTLAAQAHALTQKPVWKCRASAGYTTVNGGDRAEAVVANGNVNTARGQDPDHALCGRGESGGGNLPAPLGIPNDLLATSSASAVTTVSPELGSAREQRVGALGRVENLVLRFPGAGTIVLGVTLAEATATGACRDGVPQMTGASRVTRVTLNDTPVDTVMLAARLTQALASLSPTVDVKQDETTRTADALTIRALHIVVRLGGGGVFETVVAEAKVGTDGPVCADTTTNPCPPGTQYNPGRNLCFIPEGAFGGTLGDIPVGTPQDSGLGNSDGSYLPADVARRRYPKSPCARGPGKYRIVGTNKSNVLQGTARADRIIALGGSDRVAATRGGDCVDGGRGNDQLSGDVGNDAIYAGSGNDRINGGPGSDRIHGGTGHDTINAAFGADRIWGDKGNDFINIATAGPAARANCGRGYDTIRHNANERKRVSGCEKKGD